MLLRLRLFGKGSVVGSIEWVLLVESAMIKFVCWLLLMGEGALLCVGMYVSVLPLFMGIYMSVHLVFGRGLCVAVLLCGLGPTS